MSLVPARTTLPYQPPGLPGSQVPCQQPSAPLIGTKFIERCLSIWVPSMECLWQMLYLSTKQGLDRGIVRGARTAKAALVDAMTKNMSVTGLTVTDMLLLSKWAQLIRPVYFDLSLIQPSHLKHYFERCGCLVAPTPYPSADRAAQPVIKYLRRL